MNFKYLNFTNKDMKRKNLILICLISFFCVTCTIYISCKKENPTEGTKTIVTKNPYDFVGELHNRGMNELYSQLVIAKRDNQKVDINQFVSTFLYNEVSQSNPSVLKDQLITNINSCISSTKEICSTFKSANIDLNPKLSTFQKKYLNLIVNSLSNPQKLKDELGKIESEVLNSKEDIKEQAVVLAVSAVTKYSYDFWVAHPELLDDASTHQKVATLDGVLRADAEGAVAGVLIAAEYLIPEGALVFGPGGIVLTLVGSAVTGSLWGSGVNLIGSLFW